MSTTPLPSAPRALFDGSVALGASVLLGLYLALRRGLSVPAGVAIVATGLLLVVYASGQVLVRRPLFSGPADRVTLTRAVLGGGCASMLLLAAWGDIPLRNWWLVACAAPALILDGIDGVVARRTGTATDAGALLDMRTDAAVLIILSLAAAPTVGWWVLAIGAMRYLFVAASWIRPALRGPIPPGRQFRRVVAGLQGALLVVGLAPVVPAWLATALAAAALTLLTISFGRDVIRMELAHAQLKASEAGVHR